MLIESRQRRVACGSARDALRAARVQSGKAHSASKPGCAERRKSPSDGSARSAWWNVLSVGSGARPASRRPRRVASKYRASAPCTQRSAPGTERGGRRTPRPGRCPVAVGGSAGATEGCSLTAARSAARRVSTRGRCVKNRGSISDVARSRRMSRLGMCNCDVSKRNR